MRPITYARAGTSGEAVRMGTIDNPSRVSAAVQFLAGGTQVLDLTKLDVMRPERLVDITRIADPRMTSIEATPQGLRLGSLVTMRQAAEHPAVMRDYPVVSESLWKGASQQIRNMGRMGGNLLQRTRCSYFRDVSYPCNKREPGSGCSALEGVNRIHAVLGVTDKCIASYPGDFAQALIALDGQIEVIGPDGARVLPFSKLHLPRADTPEIETTLRPGELIVAIVIPAGPHTRRSTYVKVRDRESYAFALASAAVALDLGKDGVVRDVRIGLGGIHYAPYRAMAAEDSLRGKPLDESTVTVAADAAVAGAVTHGHNDYKPELARRTLVRALLQAKEMRV